MTYSKPKSDVPDEYLALAAESSPAVTTTTSAKKKTPTEVDDTHKAAERRKWRSYYSDMELADRFRKTCKDLHFVSDYDYWMHYDASTGVWGKVHEQVVRGLIQNFLIAEYEEATKSNYGVRMDEAGLCQRVLTSKRVLDWIAPSVAVTSSVLDTQKDLIVVANGVVDLRTSELLPFDSELLFTKRVPYPYNKGAKNKYTDAALASLPSDAAHQLKVMAGQALTGHQPSRSTIFFFWGDGSNGKSTILDLLSTTAGDYGRKPKREVLLKGGSDSNFHTITFKGLRQAIIEELPDERFLDGGAVRDLAGTTTMTGEHKGKDVEEFDVQATIFITFNNRPQVSETAHGVWRRLRLFAFPYMYVETKAEITSPGHRLQVPMLKDLFKKSEDAVIAFLAWRIEGARLWYGAHMRDPEDAPSVVKATRVWRTMNDALGHWFDENLVADPAYYCLVDDLLDDFNQWRNSPKTPWGKHNLIDKLTSHNLFLENGLEYKQAARHKGLLQATWLRTNPADWDQPRVAKTQATFVQGVRFRDSSDDNDPLAVPDDASTLEDVDAHDFNEPEEVF